MIIERHGERIDLVELVNWSHKYGRDQLAAYLDCSVEQSYIDPRDADGEWSDDNGSGALRFGRRIYRWDDHGFHGVERFDTVAEAEAAMPRSFDDYVAELETLPVVAEQLAGFGIELTSDRPGEQLQNVYGFGFVVCEALRTVAHDWGHYRLATALNRSGYKPAEATPDDDSWLVDREGWGDYLVHEGSTRPMTDREIIAHLEVLEADGYGDPYRWGQLATIGRHFYRDDSEDEALALVAALVACHDAAEREGVEL